MPSSDPPVPPPRPTLTAPGLYLDTPRASDIPRLYEACTEPEAVASLNVPQPYTQADAEAYVHLAETGNDLFWAIRLAPNEPLMGMVALRNAPPGKPVYGGHDGHDVYGGLAGPREAHLGGIYLLPPYRGGGRATVVARLVARWAFENGYTALHWQCLTANDASVVLASRLGFAWYAEGWSTSQYKHHMGKPAKFARLTKEDFVG